MKKHYILIIAAAAIFATGCNRLDTLYIDHRSSRDFCYRLQPS